jgi:hypothetical protein
MSFITGYFDSISDCGTPSNTETPVQSAPFKLWVKPDASMLPTEENTLLLVQMGKKNNQKGRIGDRTFVITKEHLLYTKTGCKDEFRGALSLIWTRVSFHQVEDESILSRGYKWKMVTIRDRKFTQLYISDTTDMLKIKKVLQRYVISTGFYEDFDIGTKIGKGAFASVSI